ncbi:hypothetical protein Tco_0429080 [Tanacetum coccineum]
MAEQDIPPPTITAMKIPIIRKGEYDIWSMRMRQYICHTDHNLWDVIVNGDLEEEPAPTGETSAPPAPKTAKQLAARRNQERVKSILLLAIPDEYLLSFPSWQMLNHSGKLSNQWLEEDINQKFLRSLPPSWNQIALIMRNKPDIDEIDIDDLYNNLRVYEDEMKSTNEVVTASGDFGVSTAGGISQVSSTPCAHDVACSFFAQPTTSPQLENEDFLVRLKIEDGLGIILDLRWQCYVMAVRKCYNCHRKGHFARESDLVESGKRSMVTMARAMHQQKKHYTQALVAQDGLGGYD